MGLAIGTGSVTFDDATGRGWTFTATSSGFTPPPGLDAQLVQNSDGSYTLTWNQSGQQDLFNSAGYLTASKNRQGNALSYAYSNGELTTITNAAGQQTTMQYDGNGRIDEFKASDGRPWQYSFDANNNLVRIDDAAGRITTFGYDSAHDLTTTTDPVGNVTNLTYNSNGSVASIVRVTGNGTGPTWSFSYGSGSTTVTDPNGHATTYTDDSSGRVTGITDAEGHTTEPDVDGGQPPRQPDVAKRRCHELVVQQRQRPDGDDAGERGGGAVGVRQ